ncbi:MAG: DNA mismatch repair endonuclease MutL [Lachnospira sp.]|nr:DNA mismatch repair endonuclease MutL [Lachnospira sp.]
MFIKVLDQSTINKIAAGEVVERPASVVKELVENAIDAGANAITVEIKDGGTSFIRVTDNGKGIEKDDIQVAFLRHSTSKIETDKDLFSISTLGFRGEALASIAAISQMELITKTNDSLCGYRYVIEGGIEKKFEEIGVPNGTTFIVKNMFFNTPARKKFLKSETTEAGYIGELIEHLALSRPDIAFTFINSGKTKLHTPMNGTLKDVIYAIYGKEIATNLLNLDYDDGYIKLSGYVAKPIIERGNRKFENYFINKRFISNNTVINAIEDAYEPYLMSHKFPFTCFMIEIANDKIDVNVHPTKMEMRFMENDKVYEAINTAISKALEDRIIPQVSITPTPKKEEPVKNVKPNVPQPFETNRIKDYSYVTTVDELIGSAKAVVKEENIIEYKPEIKEIPEPESVPDNDCFIIDRDYTIIGQVFDTYWMVECENNLFIIDQHAAHEKVLYEQLVNAINKQKCDSQALLPPIVISLSLKEEDCLKNNMSIFNELGFEIEHFGGKEYYVRAVPMQLYGCDAKQLLLEVLDNLISESTTNDIVSRKEKLASMSCKAAIKGNTRISYAEAKELLDKLLKLENPYNCPHGRPVIISMTKYEMDKKFRRIL